MTKERKKVKSPSRVQLFVTLWTVAHRAPPSMGFSRQESWSGVPLPSPGQLYAQLKFESGIIKMKNGVYTGVILKPLP